MRPAGLFAIALLACSGVVAGAGFVTGAWPARATRWPPAAAPLIDIDRLAALRPAAGALARNAEAALGAGDIAGALELYRQASQIAPGSGFADRRRCELLAALGRTDEALAACNLFF